MEKVVVVAISSNRVIGRDGGLPWHVSGDLKHFKRVTDGYPIVMGRKTFESIGKALPNRRNIVISRRHDFAAPGVERADSLDESLQMCRDAGAEKAMIIGGGEIFFQALYEDLVDRIELTEIKMDVDGDTFFPELDDHHWEETARRPQPPDTADGPAYEFITLVRRRT
jgi:dihydrofolate reductase